MTRKYAFCLTKDGWAVGWVHVIAASQQAATKTLPRMPGVRKCYFAHMPADNSQHNCPDCWADLPPYSNFIPTVINAAVGYQGERLNKMANARDLERLTDGQLPSFSSVGAYTLLYLTLPDNDTLCAGCATEEIDTTDTEVICDIYWEGDPIECDECGKQIESSYGPVETDKKG